MTRSPVRRIAALPLTLAVVGIALIVLSALPANEAEEDTAHAASAPITVEIDIDID